MESITIPAVWAWVLSGASALVLLANAAEKIGKAIQHAKAPNKHQDERIGALESRMKAVEGKLGDDKEALAALQEGNHAMYKALLALLDHGIDGNNIKQMQDAKSELQEHLINR